LKILVTGAAGMLGRDFCEVARARGHDITATDRADVVAGMDLFELDVTELAAVRGALEKFRPEIVFHFAALADVDRCETHPDEGYLANVIGTENVALACSEADVTLAFSSTGSLFGGEKTVPYTEYDEPKPISEYAKTKYLGELAIQRIALKHYIFRAGWMFGGGPKDNKFVARIIGFAKKSNEVFGVTDKEGTPTYTVDLSERMLELVEIGRPGLYHAGNEGYCSRYEFARKIVDLAGLKDCRVLPVLATKVPMPAHRPRLEALDNYKCRLLGMKPMRRWEDALKEYIEIKLG
jgi:dTDP-4-dehydrorhamnose reductase